jgi:LuxR family maltose regulon positive regulatory protein
LILDDYHVITEQQVHTTLSYLIEHLPAQLHIILVTRVDPPLPLPQLRAHGQVLEVRAQQLRCTVEETEILFKEVMGIQFPKDTIQQVTTRTEGWLVGLQLLALSLPGCADPNRLLEEVSGNQRYILDFLTDEVLRRQPQDVQTFLLSTSILEHLNASLCDAVMEQASSQKMLQRLEQANLFVTSLDSKRAWYRYHALFAEALRYRMEQTQSDLMPTLHHRASIWYAEHDQISQAILHAFHAHQWQWAADLIEQIPVVALTWGASEHELILLRQWLDQLPEDIVYSRPRLCLTCSQLLFVVAPPTKVQAWLDAAEAKLTASLAKQKSEDISPIGQDQENLLGEVTAFRALLQCHEEDGERALALCRQALALLSPDNNLVNALVATAQFWASYTTTVNDAEASVKSGLQAVSLARTAGQTALSVDFMGITATHMIGAGRLHDARSLTRQAMQLGMQARELVLPELVGWPMVSQAEILREWNQLDTAFSLAEESILLCEQTDESMAMSMYLLLGYAVLLRISLSCRELDAARSALQQVERIGTSKHMSRPFYLHTRSLFTTIDQVRLWSACGELDRATRWAKDLDMEVRSASPFVREREEVARVRVLLAKGQPDVALQQLEPVLQRATTGKRWGHVIEMRLLQALAHQTYEDETKALSALSEAVRLAEPEGYIRSFVDEGAPMETLLSRLREQQCNHGPTPYLDTPLTIFPQQNKVHKRQPKRAREHNKIPPL